jgi:hypothetical protein
MQFLKETATEQSTKIYALRAKDKEQTQPELKRVLADLAEVKVALGALCVSTRTVKVEDVPVLNFVKSPRQGKHPYLSLNSPHTLIRSADGSEEVEISALTLVVSSTELGSRFCCRLMPTCGPHNEEAMGCCGNPIEAEEMCCMDCMNDVGGKYLEADVVYLCHPKFLLKFSYALSKYEAHVICELQDAGPVAKLPFLPAVFEADYTPESERSIIEERKGATPLKVAVAAIKNSGAFRSGGLNATPTNFEGGSFGMPADEFDPTALIDGHAHLFDDVLLAADDMAVFFEAATPEHKKGMEDIANAVKIGKAQIAALTKAMKLPHLPEGAMKKHVHDMSLLVAENSALSIRSIKLFRASLLPSPATPAPAPSLSSSPNFPVKTSVVPALLTVEEQQVQLLALEAQMASLNVTLADPNVCGSVEMHAAFSEQRLQLEAEIMAARTRLRLSSDSPPPLSVGAAGATSTVSALPAAGALSAADGNLMAMVANNLSLMLARLDRMETAQQQTQAALGGTNLMIGEVISRTIIPKSFHPAMQAAADVVEQRAGSAKMAGGEKLASIISQFAGTTQPLNDLFGRAGASNIEYSAFSNSRAAGISETTEQTLLLLQISNTGGASKSIDPATRAKFSRCFPGTGLNFVKMSESPAAFSNMMTMLIGAYSAQASVSAQTGASPYVIEMDTKMCILYTAWLQYLYGSFDLAHSDPASVAAAAKATKTTELQRLLNPKHQVWSGIQAVFLACINEMWGLRVQHNTLLGADNGYTISMFHVRRYLEDLQASGWRSKHDHLLASTHVLRTSLEQLGALGSSSAPAGEAKKLTALESKIDKLSSSTSTKSADPETTKALKALAHQLSQLSESHHALKKKSGGKGDQPKTAAQEAKERASRKKWYDKNHPEEAAARKAAGDQEEDKQEE